MRGACRPIDDAKRSTPCLFHNFPPHENPTQVVLKVEMACGGCSGAVERVLTKLDGVESFEVSLEKQTAIARGAALVPAAVLEAVRKTGKKTELVQ